MRFWLCLVLTACGPSSPTEAVRVSPASPSAPARVTPASLPSMAPPRFAAPRTLVKSAAPEGGLAAAPPPITAPHGGQITALAITEDGSAVVSVDNNGRIRLWPSLDGTREPAVIPGPAPHALAVARDGEGFAIGLIDTAGGAHVIRTTPAGAVRGHLALASPSGQRATELDATAAGFLFLRADQVLELVTPDGAHVERLAPEPGTHIDSIVTRGRLALALTLEDRRLRGQWIDTTPPPGRTAPGLRWGAATPMLDGKIAHAALSPAGDRLAVTRPSGAHPALLDLATGKALPTPVCVSKHWPKDEGGEMDVDDLRRQNMLPVPLGFIDASIVACTVFNNLTWWNTSEGKQVPNHATSLTVANEPSAVFDGGVVTPSVGNLALASPAQVAYLGYQLHDVRQMYAGPGGVIVTGTGQEALEVDGALEPRARFDMLLRPAWEDAIPIDDRFAVSLTLDRSAGTSVLAVYDGLSGITRQVLPYHAGDAPLSYEPTTRLLATTDGGRALLTRFDPATHLFGPPIWLANGITTSKLRVVDPQLSGGVAALELDTASNGALLVGEIFEADLAPGRLAAPRTSYTVAGELRAVDRAGRLYMRANADGKPIDPWAAAAGQAGAPGDVIVYTHGQAGAHLTGMAAVDVRPNADGSQIAAYAAPKIMMFGADGKPRWDAAPWSGKDIAWAPDGHLVVEFPSGMATFDAATGALATRRCGWSFGVSAIPLDNSQPGPSICDGAL